MIMHEDLLWYVVYAGITYLTLFIIAVFFKAKQYLGPLLLTWINFNSGMDK